MSSKAADLLRAATAQLQQQKIATAKLDAEILLGHVFGLSRSDLQMRLPKLPISAAQTEAYAALIARRLKFEPVAYLTGTRGFWSLDFDVGPGVLIPRPDSECLIETVLEHFDRNRPLTVLDLGCGPGTLLLTILHEFSLATGLGIDCSPVALDYAQRNAQKFAVAARATWRIGNWLDGITDTYDLILCNPPYISENDAAMLMPDVLRHEPHEALFAADDGLSVYQQLIPRLAQYMRNDGLAVFETGANQAPAVCALAETCGLRFRIVPDLAGRQRCVALTLPAPILP